MSGRGSSTAVKSKRRKSQERAPNPQGLLASGRRLQRRDAAIGLDRANLGGRLPGRLHGRLVETKAPRKILTAASPHNDRGFNATIWRDEDGSKLFLQNLDRPGRIQANDAITFQAVRDLANRSGQPEEDGGEVLPATLIIQTGDTLDAKKAVLNMVKALLRDAAAADDQKSYVLKELETVPLNVLPGGHSQVALTFRIIPKAAPERVMAPASFIQLMGGPPKEDKTLKIGSLIEATIREQSTRYKDLLAALTEFHEALGKIDQKVFEVEDTNQRAKGAQDGMAELNRLAQAVVDQAQSYIVGSKTNLLSGSKRSAKADKVGVVENLQKQIIASAKNNYRAELDTLRAARLQSLNALNENQIIPGTTTILGEGAHGAVKAVSILRANGDIFRAAVKADNKQWEGASYGAGIPRENPQQSNRAVAASALNDALRLNVIPKTEYMRLTDDADGRPRQGQAIEVVAGAVGQKKIKENDTEIPEKEATDNPDFSIQVDGKWYRAKNAQANVDPTLAIVQKGLADLQLMDVLLGHVDRNPGNFIFETHPQDPGMIIGVKGIDNDDTFGKDWAPQTFDPNFFPPSKTPGVPPVIDVETALTIMRFTVHNLEPLLSHLSDDEKVAARQRFIDVQREIRARVLAGDIASTKPRAAIGPTLNQLAKLAGRDNGANLQLLRWGPDTMAKHGVQNSYAGQLQDNQAKYGTYPGPRLDRGLV